MKSITKTLLAALLCVGVYTAKSQEPMPPQPQHAPCQMMAQTVDFESVSICYSPQMRAFAAIDSAECAIHLVAMRGDRLDTVASYATDITRKRHDLKNIIRPVSVGFVGPYVVLVASAMNDTSYVALLDRDLNVVAKRNFGCTLYAFHFEHGQLMVVGRNPYGYDIHVMQLHGDLDAFEHGATLSHHYRLAKQSEKIKKSDPIGVGISAVAVSVVFLALLCILLILQGSGKIISSVSNKKNSPKTTGEATARRASSTGGNEAEIAAAIAAAISLYNDELHDEESSVITIQDADRERSPWNAKYHNMNHYFNTKR